MPLRLEVAPANTMAPLPNRVGSRSAYKLNKDPSWLHANSCSHPLFTSFMWVMQHIKADTRKNLDASGSRNHEQHSHTMPCEIRFHVQLPLWYLRTMQTCACVSQRSRWKYLARTLCGAWEHHSIAVPNVERSEIFTSKGEGSIYAPRLKRHLSLSRRKKGMEDASLRSCQNGWWEGISVVKYRICDHFLLWGKTTLPLLAIAKQRRNHSQQTIRVLTAEQSELFHNSRVKVTPFSHRAYPLSRTLDNAYAIRLLHEETGTVWNVYGIMKLKWYGHFNNCVVRCNV